MTPEPTATAPAPHPVPLVRVVVLSFNRRDQLRTTLERMTRASGYPAGALEIVVVDNASSDGSAEMVAAEHPQVRLIQTGSNLGASAVNLAIPGGTYDWLLILDDDCYLEPGDLARAVAAGAEHDAGLVSFRVRSSEEESDRFDNVYQTGLLSFWGCAVLLSRAALDRVGGYDPYIFIWGNELELTIRLLDEGFRHLHLPTVVAVHMKAAPDPDAKASARSQRLNRRHWAYTAGRLLRPSDATRVVGRLALATVVDAAARSGSWRELESLRDLGAGFRDGLANRRPVRPCVSRAVRDNFQSFANPLTFVRRPSERLGGRAEAVDRYERFRSERPGFFPGDTAALEL